MTTSRISIQKTFKSLWNTTIKMSLVQKLEKKLGLMELAMALAYNAKVNLGDVFSQVRTWDQIIYHHLRAKDIVIPRKKNAGGKKDESDHRCVCEGADHWSARLGCVLRPQQSVSSPDHAIQHFPIQRCDRTGSQANPCIDVDGVSWQKLIFVKGI